MTRGSTRGILAGRLHSVAPFLLAVGRPSAVRSTSRGAARRAAGLARWLRVRLRAAARCAGAPELALGCVLRTVWRLTAPTRHDEVAPLRGRREDAVIGQEVRSWARNECRQAAMKSSGSNTTADVPSLQRRRNA